MNINYKAVISYALGFIISISALIWLAQVYDIEDLAGPLSSADYKLLLLAVAISILDYILRTIRWRLLFLEYKPKKSSNVFRALMQGYLFNLLLPARAGDLVRVHRLGKDESIPRSAVLGTVLIERVGDMVVLIILFMAVFLFYPDLPEWFKYAGVLIALLTTIIIIALAVIHFHGHRLKPVFLLLLNRFFPEHVLSRMGTSGKIFVEGLASLFKMKSIFSFLAITILLWVLAVLFAYYIAGSVGLWISMENLLFVMLVIVVGTMIPSSPGHIGVYELIGVAGLDLVGITGGVALSFIVMLHAVTILVPGVIGSLCLLKRDGKSIVFSQKGIEKE